MALVQLDDQWMPLTHEVGARTHARPDAGRAELPNPSATNVRCRLSHPPKMQTPNLNDDETAENHAGHSRENDI
jgi:hypothetical protein